MKKLALSAFMIASMNISAFGDGLEFGYANMSLGDSSGHGMQFGVHNTWYAQNNFGFGLGIDMDYILLDSTPLVGLEESTGFLSYYPNIGLNYKHNDWDFEVNVGYRIGTLGESDSIFYQGVGFGAEARYAFTEHYGLVTGFDTAEVELVTIGPADGQTTNQTTLNFSFYYKK